MNLPTCISVKASLLTKHLGRESEAYDDRYGPSPGPYDEQPSGYLPPQQNAGYPSQQNYPANPYFAPPPTAEHAYAPDAAYPPAQEQQQAAAYPTYNPADYGQPGAAAEQPYPYGATRGAYGDSEANLGAPYGNETFAGDSRYAAPVSPLTPHEEPRRGRDPQPPNNVSEHETPAAGTSTGLSRS